MQVLEELPDTTTISCGAKLVGNVLEAAEYPCYSSRYMVRGAGHDSNYIDQVAPAVMIFVPSKGGRSHVEVDESNWDDCETGANVLLHVMLKSANDKRLPATDGHWGNGRWLPE